MKRDLDLLRKILLHLENDVEYGNSINSTKLYQHFTEYKESEFLYQIFLLNDSGLITATDRSGNDYKLFYIKEITSKGHDFIDSFREQDIWNQTKEKVKSIGSFTLDTFMEIGKEYIKQNMFN
ncbi:MAG: DUF2513 domain-containing protein [Sulfurimonas sp.]|nr:DUF2513 domain-containing protein [Sulfurimonas sp.]